MAGKRILSARAAGLAACHACAKLSAADTPRCPRCGAPLHPRKPHSMQRAWAWLLSGLILYAPANLYPIMITETLGRAEANTIIGGVVALFEHGSYLVAVVVFGASVLIPLLKFFVMAYLLITIHNMSRRRLADRHRLFRIVEFIGRWSMIDVFVVAILAALVQLSGLGKVLPGPAAGAFAAMVVCTMLSAAALDPRLLWDAENEFQRS